MTFKILPLYTDKNYAYRIPLGKKSYRLRFRLNERQSLYHFDIYTDGDIPLYLGVALLPQAYTSLKLPDNPGTFILVPKITGTVFADVDPSRIGDFYSFLFFEEDE